MIAREMAAAERAWRLQDAREPVWRVLTSWAAVCAVLVALAWLVQSIRGGGQLYAALPGIVLVCVPGWGSWIPWDRIIGIQEPDDWHRTAFQEWQQGAHPDEKPLTLRLDEWGISAPLTAYELRSVLVVDAGAARGARYWYLSLSPGEAAAHLIRTALRGDR